MPTGASPPAAAARRTALVTGASAGIGAAFAQVFAAAGFDVVLTARREARLQGVARQLAADHSVRVEVVVADLGKAGAATWLGDEIASRGVHIDALVNNAGYGLPGAFVEQPWARHSAFLQVLVVAVTELTHRLLPGMLAAGYGRIVNVASLAGLMPAPAGHTLYFPAKAFVLKFSEALARETRGQGVHVTALAPGFTRTEFHEHADLRARLRVLPAWAWSTADDVAAAGFAAVMAGRPLVVPGRANRAAAAVVRVLPRFVVDVLARRASADGRP